MAGLDGIGALAWDATRDKLWACSSGTQAVYLITIDGSSATADHHFTPEDGCIDGLAYDGVNDTLFTSGDVRDTVDHYDTGGVLLDTRYVGDSLGDCDSSGIAIGGGDLFLANNGCQEIYRVANEQGAVPELFASFPRRIEDMECDDVTFADQGKAAIWAQDAYDAEIHAFELNPGDCGVGGLPSGKFVYVALGDSYQSGEGVGNSIADTDAYLTSAYEDGFNYPDALGAQENTYSAALEGNSCHRALLNYAKLNRDRLEPGSEVVLVDRTCSGAKIEPGGKPAIVGTSGSAGPDPDSQVMQAVDRLAAAGIDRAEVDLVTVGMGGNDAKFGDIVAGCLMPSLLRKVVEAHPNPPGDIAFLADRLGCDFWDRLIFHTDEAIDTLEPKEEWGQTQLLGMFENARIMQLNYPDVLPSQDEVPGWCGGIDRDDINFAKEKVTQIEQVIADSIADTSNPRLELVDIEDAFGRNPLCPPLEDDQLANGLVEDNVDAEIRRLLNLDGTGDPVARDKVDTLIDRYRTFRNCLLNRFCRFDELARQTRWDATVDAARDLLDYFEDQDETVLANLIEPPEPDAEPEDVRFDRSRGLFHPNATGFEVMACHVRAAYADASAGLCFADPDRDPDTIDLSEWFYNPFLRFPGDELDVNLQGFQPNSPVIITYYSDEVDLGQVVADANGDVTTQVQVPDAGPGVHRLEFAGVAANGTQLVKEARIQVPGDPIPGQTYGTYLCCFDAGVGDDGVIEAVDVTYLEFTFTEIPDPAGGILLELPVPDDAGPGLSVEAVSQLTGQRIVHDLFGSLERTDGGNAHSLAVDSGGTVWAWGDNASGQLGNNTTTDQHEPVAATGLEDVVGVAAGGAHSLAVDNNRTVWAWGSNTFGQLGDGTTSNRDVPVEIPGVAEATDVAAGNYHSLAATADGSVWAWGLNNAGQLGDGTTTTRPEPVRVQGLSDVTAVAAGGLPGWAGHSLALRADGTVWAWGYNKSGQLGDDTKTHKDTPVQVPGLSEVVAIAADGDNSYALKSDGTVWSWGDNGYDQLGNPDAKKTATTPVQVNITDVHQIAAGGTHALASTTDGTVWAWGNNNTGQLGHGSCGPGTPKTIEEPVQVADLTGAVGIAGGYVHSLATLTDNSAWTWGSNSQGQLGDGTTSPSCVPVAVTGFPG